jgi:hypothetical protein
MAWLDVKVQADSKSDNKLDSGDFNFYPSKGLDEKKILIYLGIAAAVYLAFKAFKKRGR